MRTEKASPPVKKPRRAAVAPEKSVRITENEADIIISLRRMKKEQTDSFDEVLLENGRKLDH